MAPRLEGVSPVSFTAPHPYYCKNLSNAKTFQATILEHSLQHRFTTFIVAGLFFLFACFECKKDVVF